jgi:hypothetical protein
MLRRKVPLIQSGPQPSTGNRIFVLEHPALCLWLPLVQDGRTRSFILAPPLRTRHERLSTMISSAPTCSIIKLPPSCPSYVERSGMASLKVWRRYRKITRQWLHTGKYNDRCQPLLQCGGSKENGLASMGCASMNVLPSEERRSMRFSIWAIASFNSRSTPWAPSG